MTVYVASGCNYYECGWTLGVYSTREKAQDAIDRARTHRITADYWEIEEFTLDEVEE